MVPIPETLENAIAHHREGRFEEAVAIYRSILQIEPNNPDALHLFGVVAHQKGRPDFALTLMGRAIKQSPKIPLYHSNIGLVYQALDNWDLAVESFLEAIRLQPDYAEAYCNLGAAMSEKGHLETAIEQYKRAIAFNPFYTEAYNNLGVALKCKGDLESARTHFDKAIQLNPGFAVAYINRASINLLLGNFLDGWNDFEWRIMHADWKYTYPILYDKPCWDGKPFHGKRLLIQEEQGIGDTLQFIRYLPMVKALGGTVIFETVKSLKGLLQFFPGIDELTSCNFDGKPETDFDLYIHHLSLPKLFGTTLETIPAAVPYIFANPLYAAYWEKLLKGTDFKVGIVWAGRPEHTNDHNRSCGLKYFEPLFTLPGIKIYGLQKGTAALEANNPLYQDIFVNFDEKFKDFNDTAGAIHNLDLVISVDTSVAHLAGAMGKPVWLLLPFSPDWRWMVGRDESPWYPSMRLFRQPRNGNWGSVFKKVESELKKTLRHNFKTA
ncbi:MAG: tetratricopeptide repeat-containing glycosyltransferase family protein [Desulfobacterales bacterium]|nr:tetratricopeptide repeat-containing glycosyltransferase family protein [Desulfobacterales bacterium]